MVSESTKPGLYAIADFRRLWFIGLAAFVVRWLEMLAFGLYVYQVTESAFLVAMVSMLRLLPMGLFGAFLGVAAERFDRRSALVVTTAVSLACTGALAILASLDAIQVWHLGVASFINGTCWAADNPVRRSMIGDVVGHDRMGAAMSIDIGTNNASRIVGPVLSGVLLAYTGIAGVFWLGGVLYAVSLLAALKVRARREPGSTRHASFAVSMREGLDWIRGDPRLIGVFLVTVIFNVLGWPYTSMIPVIATDYLHLGPEEVGVLASSDGVGGLLGALLFAAFARPHWYGKIYLASVGVFLAMIIGFVLAPTALLAGLFLLLGGMSSVGFAVMQATLVYRGSPPEMRPRLLGVLSMCIGTAPLGFFYLGFLVDVLTPRVGTVVLAAQGVIALGLTWRYWPSIIKT